MGDPVPRRYLSRREAAEYALVTTRTIDRAVRARRLRSRRGARGRRVFLPEWLDEWTYGRDDDESEEDAA